MSVSIMYPMLNVYISVLGRTKALYCSTPITSGKRYFNWLDQINQDFDLDDLDDAYRELHFQDVIEPNQLYAQNFIQKLRGQYGQVVIDPTAITANPNWVQKDWHFFWGIVIERHVQSSFFIDDWQYSNGCVYEFYKCQSLQIPTFTEEIELIGLNTGIELISEAISFIQGRGKSTEFIEENLKKLKDLSAMKENAYDDIY